MKGYVYVLTNPAMPNLVKIGHTTQASPRLRIDDLYTSGVPLPYDVEFVLETDHPKEVEMALHAAFAPQRMNPKREFFAIEPEQAIGFLKLLEKFGGKDVTEEVKKARTKVDNASNQANKTVRNKKPRLNFKDLKIPPGSKLQFTRGNIEIEVVGEYSVRYPGEEDLYTLNGITQPLIGKHYDVQPSRFWRYQGRLLFDLYHEYHDSLGNQDESDNEPPDNP